MYKGKSLISACIGVLATGLGPSIHALAVEPANFQAGPVLISPELDVEAGYTDNLLRSHFDERSTWYSELTPRIQAWLQNGLNTYSLKYQLVDYRYASSHEDDFTDHRVNLDVHHEFDAKNVVNLFGEYFDGHEKRGQGTTDGIARLVPTPVEYERGTFGGDYSYGNRSSKGRITLEAKRDDYDYQNYREFTRYRDRKQDTLNGIFYWRVGNRTDALIQARVVENDYSENSPDSRGGALDSEEYNYLVGLSWDATAKTSGSVKIGAYERDYTSEMRSDDDGFHWEVDLTYKPRTYSALTFGTRRYTRETNGFGNSIDTEEYGLGWKHEWSSRSETSIGVRARNEDYTGTSRDDDRLDWDASYHFAARRWLDLAAGFRREERDSTDRLFEYTRNQYYLEAKLSL